jgi:hypothetical protein
MNKSTARIIAAGVWLIVSNTSSTPAVAVLAALVAMTFCLLSFLANDVSK